MMASRTETESIVSSLGNAGYSERKVLAYLPHQVRLVAALQIAPMHPARPSSSSFFAGLRERAGRRLSEIEDHWVQICRT